MQVVKTAFLLVCLILVPASLFAADKEPSREVPEASAQELEQEVAPKKEEAEAIEFQPFESASDYWLAGYEEKDGATQSWVWGSCTQTCAPCRRNSDCPPMGPLNQKCWPFCP